MYSRFVRAYLQQYLIGDKYKGFRSRFKILFVADVKSVHGITGINSVEIRMQDIPGKGLTLEQNTRVISHELCHALIEFNNHGAEMHRKLHSYDGENPTKDRREIMARFKFRAAWKFGKKPELISVRVLDFQKLLDAE